MIHIGGKHNNQYSKPLGGDISIKNQYSAETCKYYIYRFQCFDFTRVYEHALKLASFNKNYIWQRNTKINKNCSVIFFDSSEILISLTQILHCFSLCLKVILLVYSIF